MNKQCRKALAVLSAVILTATSLSLEAKQNPNNLAYAKTLKEIEQEKKEKQDQIDQKKEELKKEAEAAKVSTFTVISESGEEDPAVSAKIMARQEAKKAKNYQLADQIRNELKSEGIEVTDIPNGAKWKRI